MHSTQLMLIIPEDQGVKTTHNHRVSDWHWKLLLMTTFVFFLLLSGGGACSSFWRASSFIQFWCDSQALSQLFYTWVDSSKLTLTAWLALSKAVKDYIWPFMSSVNVKMKILEPRSRSHITWLWRSTLTRTVISLQRWRANNLIWFL